MTKGNFLIALLIGAALLFFAIFFYVYTSEEEGTTFTPPDKTYREQQPEPEKKLSPPPATEHPANLEKQESQPQAEFPAYFNENDKKFLRDKERYTKPQTPPKANAGTYQD